MVPSVRSGPVGSRSHVGDLIGPNCAGAIDQVCGQSENSSTRHDHQHLRLAGEGARRGTALDGESVAAAEDSNGGETREPLDTVMDRHVVGAPVIGRVRNRSTRANAVKAKSGFKRASFRTARCSDLPPLSPGGNTPTTKGEKMDKRFCEKLSALARTGVAPDKVYTEICAWLRRNPGVQCSLLNELSRTGLRVVVDRACRGTLPIPWTAHEASVADRAPSPELCPTNAAKSVAGMMNRMFCDQVGEVVATEADPSRAYACLCRWLKRNPRVLFAMKNELCRAGLRELVEQACGGKPPSPASALAEG